MRYFEILFILKRFEPAPFEQYDVKVIKKGEQLKGACASKFMTFLTYIDAGDECHKPCFIVL